MKRLLPVSFILVAVLSVLVACAKPAPAPSPTAAVPKPTAQAAPIVLKFADFQPAVGPTGESYKWWATEVEKRTSGRVKVELFMANALVGTYEILNAVRTGLAQMGPSYPGFHPADMPLLTVANPIIKPGITNDYVLPGLLAQERLRELPAIQAEYKKNNLQPMFPSGQTPDYIETKKPLKSLDDLKGLRLRAWGANTEIFKIWGAVPVDMPGNEVYDAAQKGVIDGNHHPVNLFYAFKLHEVIKNITMFSLTLNVGQDIVMNLKTWNSLPPDIQTIINNLNKEFARKQVEILGVTEKKAIDDMKAVGVQFWTPPAAEEEKYRAMVQPMLNKWIEDKTKAGLPAKEVFDFFYKALEDAKKAGK